MAETVTTRHRISGAVDRNTPVHIAEHPVLGRHLDIVADDAKPFVPELHKPKTEPKAEVKIPTPNKKDVTDGA